MSKRQRIPSPSESQVAASSSLMQSTAKVTRIAAQGPNNAHPLLCTLPPTCNHQPTPLASVKDLESHYASYHAHVCEEKGCLCVFPDARLLELHQTECHDPLAAIRKEKGEKIFACHLPPTTCNKFFLTPKARRLHLIQVHGYPKEYFFAVTNKGVGGLLKKWGEGASMIRGQWKSRENGNAKQQTEEGDEDEDRNMQVSTTSDDISQEEEASEEEEGTVIDEDEEEPTESTAVSHRNEGARQQPQTRTNRTGGGGGDLENLADSMNALSLVPSSIRFGRGGKQAGFNSTKAHQQQQQQQHQQNASRRSGASPSRSHSRAGRGGGGRGGGAGPPPAAPASDRMDVDVMPPLRGRGMPRGMLRVVRGVHPRGVSRGRLPPGGGGGGRGSPGGWTGRGRGRGGS